MEPPNDPAGVDLALLRRLFPQHDKEIRRYVDMLATTGVQRGLIGPREAGRLWERHILNCVVVSELIPAAAHVIDLGSGAGLPGIVVALARPDVTMTLLEPSLRRSTFLQEALGELELANTSVCRARAEELRTRRGRTAVTDAGWPVPVPADVVVARAVAPLATLAGWALPLLRPRGSVLALKGTSVDAELEQSRAALRRLGAGSISIHSLGAGVVTPPTTVVRIESTGRQGG